MASMIHPSKRAEITNGRTNGCIVDDVFQQLGVLEAKSGEFIYILDEHAFDTTPTNSKIRHLVITSGWRRATIWCACPKEDRRSEVCFNSGGH